MNLYLVDITAFFQTFMEEMTRKQPDVDKVTKTYKRRDGVAKSWTRLSD